MFTCPVAVTQPPSTRNPLLTSLGQQYVRSLILRTLDEICLEKIAECQSGSSRRPRHGRPVPGILFWKHEYATDDVTGRGQCTCRGLLQAKHFNFMSVRLSFVLFKNHLSNA